MRALFLVSQAHSSWSDQPSLSSSRSSALQVPSPSGSLGVSVSSSGSQPQMTSSRSDQPSLSSSRSSVSRVVQPGRTASGLPSRSWSRCAQASVGNASRSSRWPSLSSSVSHRSSHPSKSESPEWRSMSTRIGVYRYPEASSKS